MGGTTMWDLQDGRYLRRDGGNQMQGPLNLYGRDPTSADEAVRKAYVDTLIGGAATPQQLAAAIALLTGSGGIIDTRIAAAVALYLPLVGGVMTGAITLPGAPVNPLHAATKAYSDLMLPLVGGVMTGAITLPGAPTLPLHAATMGYSDLKLPLVGGVMTGAITLPGAPTLALHAATKAYVDALPTHLATYDAVVAAAGGDYTSVAAACAGEPAGARIFITDGTYVSNTTDITMKDHQQLIGQSREDTVIDFVNANFNIVDSGAGTHRVIENLTVRRSTKLDTIDMDSNYGRISNCMIEGAGVTSSHGVLLGGWGSTMKDCLITGFTKAGAFYGIRVQGNACHLYGNNFSTCSNGILTVGNDCTITGNAFDGITTSHIVAGWKTIITGNDMYGSAGLTINQDSITISGNLLQGSISWGGAFTKVLITANHFVTGGVNCNQAGAEATISGNLFDAGTGIIWGGTESAISGNIFLGAADLTFSAGSKYNIASGNNFAGSATAAGSRINDLGLLGNAAYNNQGIPATSEKYFTDMQNTSGGALADGDVVVQKNVASGNEFDTTTTQGDPLVCGVVNEAINNAAWGFLQRKGKITTLKVNGTVPIAIGDHLGTYTAAGISMKAATGDTAFAIALEAYAVADSAGVIDALLIEPLLLSGSNYAGILVVENVVATVILLQHGWEPVTVFTTDMPEKISNGTFGSDLVTVGETGDYEIFCKIDAASAGAAKTYGFSVFAISSTGDAITGATQANPCVITSNGHSFINGDRVKIDGVVGMTELNGQIYTVANVGVNDYELNDDNGGNINSGAYGAYAGPGTGYLATEIETSHSHRLFGAGGDIGSTSGGGIAALTLNDTLELFVMNTTDATNVTVENCQLSIRKV